MVDALVCVEHRFDVEVRLGVSPAGGALDGGETAERRRRAGHIAGSDEEPGDAVEDERPRDHRAGTRRPGSRRLALRRRQDRTARPRPPDRALPLRQRSTSQSTVLEAARVDGDPGQSVLGMHFSRSVGVVVRVAVQVDRHSGATRDGDRLGRPLLGTETAREHDAVSCRYRPRDRRGADAHRQHDVDVDERSPDLRLRPSRPWQSSVD